jgi:hypothetical protein
MEPEGSVLSVSADYTALNGKWLVNNENGKDLKEWSSQGVTPKIR